MPQKPSAQEVPSPKLQESYSGAAPSALPGWQVSWITLERVSAAHLAVLRSMDTVECFTWSCSRPFRLALDYWWDAGSSISGLPPRWTRLRLLHAFEGQVHPESTSGWPKAFTGGIKLALSATSPDHMSMLLHIALMPNRA